MRSGKKRSFSFVGQRKGVFWTLLISYLLILILPVVMGAFFFHRISAVMVDNANRSNMAMLEQVKQVTDQKIKEINEVILQIAYNPKLQWLLRSGNEESPQDLYKFIEYMKELYRFRQVNGPLDNFYIYFANTNKVLTPVSKVDAEYFFTVSQIYQDMNYETIKSKILTGYHLRTFLPSQWISAPPNVKQKVIPVVQSLPLGERNDIDGSLVLLIDEQQFNDLLKQIETANHSTIYIVDDNNQLIMSTDESSPASVEPILSKLSQGLGTMTDGNGKELLLTLAASKESGWQYIAVTPKETVMSEVDEVKTAALLLLLLCLAAGTGACYAMAYWNYSPVREVVNALIQGKQGTQKTISNEYEFIKSSISASLEEEKQLKNTLLQQAPIMKANFLIRLMNGQAEAGKVSEAYLQTMGIQFASESFCVILIDIDEQSGFIKEGSEEEWTLARFTVANIGSELLKDEGYIVELGRNQLAVLINPASGAEQSHLFARSFVRKLREVIEGRFKMKITTAVSNFHQGLGAIGLCYRETLIALDYKMIRGRGSNIEFEEIKELKRGDYHYPIELEVQLINLAKNGDYDAIGKQLDELFNLNFRMRSISPEMGKCLIFDLLGTILKLHNTLSLTGKKLFGEDEDLFKAMANVTAAEEMLEKVKQFFHRVCRGFSEERTDHSDRLHQRITKYIDENYGNGSLSLTLIADHFQITSPYLSNFFKKHSGENITDYIARVRIARSKELLEDKTLTISAIAQQIGYSNDIGLIRFFKKYEGITPGKYRELLESNLNPESPDYNRIAPNRKRG